MELYSCLKLYLEPNGRVTMDVVSHNRTKIEFYLHLKDGRRLFVRVLREGVSWGTMEKKVIGVKDVYRHVQIDYFMTLDFLCRGSEK